MPVQLDLVVTHGIFSLDGQDFEVDNNIWLIGDDEEVLVIDAAHHAAPIVDAAIQQGLLVNRTSDTVVRLLPPYIITSEEIDEGIALLDAALIAAFGGQRS